MERTTGSADDLLQHVLRDWRLHCHGSCFFRSTLRSPSGRSVPASLLFLSCPAAVLSKALSRARVFIVHARIVRARSVRASHHTILMTTRRLYSGGRSGLLSKPPRGISSILSLGMPPAIRRSRTSSAQTCDISKFAGGSTAWV